MYKQRTKEFHDIVLETMPLHHNNFINTNTDASFIGYYDKDQYYKPHHDSVQFTCLIWMYKEPKKFFGGNTRLVPIDATIECIPNRMLFFPSYIQHEVTSLKASKNIPFGYGRFGITHFYNWSSSNS
jgi:Rps23 Pro-64 3,4-dihydroxylase Tpa1-like proline 4-hydroxylase